MMRRAWIITIILLLGALSLGVWQALRSERFLLAVADWAMDRFTDLRLELRNPRIALLEGHVSADEIHLLYRETDGPALVSVLAFEGSTRIGDLLNANLANSALKADQLLIYVNEGDDTENPAPLEWLQYLTWLPKQLEIDSMHVITHNERTLVFPLIELRGDRHEGRNFKATAWADYEGEPLHIELLLHALRDEVRFTGIEISGNFSAPESDSSIDIAGNLRGTREDFEYDFSVDGRYGDIDAFLKGLREKSVLDGSVVVQGRMRGNTDGFTLSEGNLVLDNMPSYGFEAGGELHYSFDGESRLHIFAAGEMSSLEYLLAWIDTDLSDFGAAQANIEITGSLGMPYIEQFILSTEQENGLTVNVSGSSYMPWIEPQQAMERENSIHVDLLGPSLAVLEPWTGPIDFDLGAWRASGTLTGDRKTIAVENLILETGSRESVRLRLTGSLDNVLGLAQEGLAGLKGIDAVVEGYTSDSSHVAELLVLDIPAGHELEASLDIAGNGDRLLVSGGRIDVTALGLDSHAIIEHALVTPLEETKLTEVRSQIELHLEDSTIAERYLHELELPALGAVSASAELNQYDSRFALENLRGGTTSEEIDVSVSGRIPDIEKLTGTSLGIDFDKVKLARVFDYLVEDFTYNKPLGHLHGQFRVVHEGSEWNVNDLKIDTSEPGGAASIRMSGSIQSVTELPKANLKADYALRDPDLLEALLGLRLQPLTINASARTRPGKVTVSSRSQIGRTRFNMGAVLEHQQDQVTGLRLAVTTPHLYLDDLGLQSRRDGRGEYRPADRLDTDTSDLSEKLLHTPPPFPFKLQFEMDGITGDNTNIEAFSIYVSGEDGQYTLRDFTVDYADTMAELRGIIDLNTQPPAVSLGIEAVAVPANAVSRDVGLDTDVSGTLTLRGGITAYGHNLEEMKPTLDGSIAVALKDAVIEGAAYDVLATDFLAWIYSGAALETSTTLDCTMALLEFDGGIVSTDTLFIETPKMIATGEGELDMVKERIDLTITPMSKSRAIQVPSSVRIRGPLDNVTPIISPVKAVMNVSAEALTLIPRLTMKMFGVRPSNRKNQPCEP
jgi:hypothetical protein